MAANISRPQCLKRMGLNRLTSLYLGMDRYHEQAMCECGVQIVTKKHVNIKIGTQITMALSVIWLNGINNLKTV